MVGAGASLAPRVRWRRVARRTVVLLLLGLLFNAWGDTGADMSQLRIPGVLQMIAVAGVLAAVVTALTRRPAIVAAVALALAAVHGLVLSNAPLACGTGRLVPGCSASWAVDRHVFGLAHVYHQGEFGHDPEGLLTALLGATAVVLVGWAIGRALYVERDRVAAIGIATVLLSATGIAALLWPPNKRVWTPTFGLLLAAGCTLVLVGLAYALDGRVGRSPQPLRWTLTALGRNALLVYVGQHVVLASLEATPSGDGTLASALLEHVGSALGVAALAVAAWTVVAAILHILDWHPTV
jgi:predicted acyltransferase